MDLCLGPEQPPPRITPGPDCGACQIGWVWMHCIYDSAWEKWTLYNYHRPPNFRLCLQSAGYKFCNLTSFIRLYLKIKNINNISFQFIMLTDNNEIFRNCFVIFYCHLTKVSSQINKCIIFVPNELSITLSTLC